MKTFFSLILLVNSYVVLASGGTVFRVDPEKIGRVSYSIGDCLPTGLGRDHYQFKVKGLVSFEYENKRYSFRPTRYSMNASKCSVKRWRLSESLWDMAKALQRLKNDDVELRENDLGETICSKSVLDVVAKKQRITRYEFHNIAVECPVNHFPLNSEIFN